MNYELPQVLMLRGIAVRRQREGGQVRVTAGPFNTTCPALRVWPITQLLVEAAVRACVCPVCGKSG